MISIVTLRGGGGGVGGFRPMILETLILRYELKGKARTHSVAHVRPRSKNSAKNQN